MGSEKTVKLHEVLQRAIRLIRIHLELTSEQLGVLAVITSALGNHSGKMRHKKMYYSVNSGLLHPQCQWFEEEGSTLCSEALLEYGDSMYEQAPSASGCSLSLDQC